MSYNLIPGVPNFSRKMLSKSRDNQPISTIHIDTNGPMRNLGVYGTAGSIRYFLSTIDDQTS
ncbi:hypothetical protein PHMEG_00019241 [Phytophthora megakarya]|uniref:Uncharacterized protein n=1 Tax=Phytophthora megakarya TaxID=4795 RepID=A0A225VS18_9STRA|nr:hypothetical protein PHMEG_00019241 [Phytophthora megakarya]